MCTVSVVVVVVIASIAVSNELKLASSISICLEKFWYSFVLCVWGLKNKVGTIVHKEHNIMFELLFFLLHNETFASQTYFVFLN